jgi:hypothetical protein
LGRLRLERAALTLIKASQLRPHLVAGDYIEIELKESVGGDSYEGFVVGLTDSFLLMENFSGWTTDGVCIFPLKYINAITHDQVRKDRQAILTWKGVTPTEAFDWLNLSGFKTLFASALAVGATVGVHDDDGLEIGVVLAVFEDRVRLKVISTGGAWLEEPLDFPFDEIVIVETGDEYSSLLRRYAERTDQASDVRRP